MPSVADRQTLRLFWLASIKHRQLALKSLLFPFAMVLMGVAAPLLLGKALAALLLPNGDPMLYVWWFVGVATLALSTNRIGHVALMQLEAYVLRDLQEETLVTLLGRSISFHNNNIGGKLVSDAIDYPTAYARLVDAIVTSLFPLALTLCIGSVVIYTESWMLGAFITFITALIVGLGIRDSRAMAPRRALRLKAGKDVTAHLADSITNIQTTKTFAQEDQEIKNHQFFGDEYLDIRLTDWKWTSTRGNNRMWLLAASQALLVVVLIYLVKRDPSLLGMGIFAFSFTVTLSNRLFEINFLIRNIEEALLQASPMTAISGVTPETQDAPQATALRVEGGTISLQSVGFAYSDAKDTPVFSDLSLDIAAGEKIGLVGPSGGGKSTLTRLLLRFDDITAGEITIDGQNIAQVTQQSLRKHIAYVPQEPLLFHRTISENIAYGKPGATQQEIKHAAKLAHAHEFIRTLPGGYETVVGERGVKLSGGQRQRIAIARAILKDAPILLLDEATSALDSESEVLIQDALWKLMKGRTTVIVAHRLSTIQKMDRIIVLKNGKIAEQGPHKELLKKKGVYAKLWAHQSGGFIEE